MMYNLVNNLHLSLFSYYYPVALKIFKIFLSSTAVHRFDKRRHRVHRVVDVFHIMTQCRNANTEYSVQLN